MTKQLGSDKTHRRRTTLSGDDRQNSPSISRQNRPSATRALSEKVEESFYSPTTTAQTAVHAKKEFEAQDLLAKVQEDPDLSQQLLRLLLSSAISKL